MKTAKLGDLLTTEQMDRVLEILNKQDGDIEKLKEYLTSIQSDLEAEGVFPDYLAYAIWYQFQQKQIAK